MKARITAITASLALVAVAALAGEHPADSSQLRGASAKLELLEPPIRLAAAEDSSATRYPSSGRRAAPAESPARDPESGEWGMLLAGFLGAAAIARRRMSS